jgi:hypothetical protein
MSTETKFMPPIPSEYGFQNVMVGPAPRPEPPHVAPSRIDADAVVKRFDLSSVEEIDSYLKSFGFPASLGYSGRVKHHASGGSSASFRTIYDLGKVEEWEATILRLADRIRKVR